MVIIMATLINMAMILRSAFSVNLKCWLSSATGALHLTHVGVKSGDNIGLIEGDEFDIYNNSRGRLNCQGKLGCRGPVSPASGGWPKIKLDLTADEELILPPVRREVFHPYSDRPEGGIWANCYAYEEAFAEKL